MLTSEALPNCRLDFPLDIMTLAKSPRCVGGCDGEDVGFMSEDTGCANSCRTGRSFVADRVWKAGDARKQAEDNFRV